MRGRVGVSLISDPAELRLTLLAAFDRYQLSGAFRYLNQLAIAAERGEEIAMQHKRRKLYPRSLAPKEKKTQTHLWVWVTAQIALHLSSRSGRDYFTQRPDS